MRKKKVIISCNLSTQTRIYLQNLEIIDARTGKVRKDINISNLINQALKVYLERKHGDPLRKTYLKRLIAEKNAEIQAITKDIQLLAAQSRD